MNNHNQGDLDLIRPRMLVTQKRFDAATPEERERFNYAVDESILPEPFWITPVSEPEDD